ncbi:purine and uridine phosphorylase [Aspergillus steynii IBT 23096]|uniref:Purine and uridine phosphorylase n=1 Tax=Aspergillus steynii IBT 23096 TaxID=1392250 RepID=A0A2I2G7F0_9EURO|nr:purine and uridine phosphorylase [Aspergillus steynii IBT 23096]PLB48791.1 purine and uridine phosphorylase [Aspergillus steynii IBT 23096]
MLANGATGPPDRRTFEIAIFCALVVEADAVIALFDEIWDQDGQFMKAHGDNNSYTIGLMCQHRVVLAHMPRIGKVSASTVAANLRFTFPHIRLGLLVGICGVVPLTQAKREILLGDVIITTHVIQSDFGMLYPHIFARNNLLRDNPARPSEEIACFLSKLQEKAVQSKLRDRMRTNLRTISSSPDFALSTYPGVEEDKVFEAAYIHKHDTKACATGICSDDDVCPEALEMSCTELGCDLGKLVPRTRIQQMAETGSSLMYHSPEIHFGGMLSDDQVIKSALHRDLIAQKEGVIAFEMEGAGLSETIPTMVVKGSSDYADSHKNKRWQPYAAATAAACKASSGRISG